MKLLIDIGNSRLKWACLRDNRLESPAVIDYRKQGLKDAFINALQSGERPSQVYVANVAGRDIAEELAAVIMQQWQVPPVFARVERECAGVSNGYDDITQLGIDRWLAVVAAWSRFQTPVCIVSCGTAVTVDAVADSGRHLGGLIIPGLHMMQTALARETSGINAEPGENFTLEFGRSTAECINYGAVRAIVSLVNNVAADMSEKYGQKMARLITGGYAGQVKALLTDKFEHDPHLVLHGLAIVAEKTT